VPLWQRVPLFLLTAGFLGFVAASLGKAIMHGQHVSIVPLAVFVLFPVLLCHRLTGLSYRIGGQEMVIRNYFRTRHVPVSQIEGLDIGRASAGSALTVRVLTDGGPVPIDVISVLRPAVPWPAARHMARLEQQRRALADWIALANSQADPGTRTG